MFRNRLLVLPLDDVMASMSRRLVLPDGTVYEGELVDGEMHGHGVLRMKDSGEYTGQWKHGLHHGKGKLTLPTGYVYEGQWEKGKKNGYGVMVDDGGRKYEGEWSVGRQHGTGTMTYGDAETVFSGQWRAGVPHGKGMLTRENGTIIRGVWADGKKQDNWAKRTALGLWRKMPRSHRLIEYVLLFILLLAMVHVLLRRYGWYASNHAGMATDGRPLEDLDDW